MKTIIGFDSWTGGASKFARLVPALSERGYRMVLIHLGSWGGDAGRPLEESLGGLTIRDIAYYKGKGFDEILIEENPNVVVFLSNDVFAHRAFNRYCLAAGVPTLHLYHGLVGVQAVNTGKLYSVNFFNQARFVLGRIPKALSKVWPCYGRALMKTGGTGADWRRFLSDILSLAKGAYIARAAADSRASRCAVYTATDISHAVGKYGYQPEDVRVVGNPDIHMFGLAEDMIGGALKRVDPQFREIIYIDTGLVYAGMVFDDGEDYLEHIRKTQEDLRLQGFHMPVKLHPHHFRTDFPKRLETIGVEILDNENFASRLLNCTAAIVEPTTVALVPALMGLPMFLARHGKLVGQAYGEILVNYPRSMYLDDVSAVGAQLRQEIGRLDSSCVNHWVRENTGPLPANEMSVRVADLLVRMAAEAGKA